LSNFKIKIEQINLIKLKFDLTITLVLLIITRQSTKYLFFIIKRSKTIITIFKVMVSISLINLIIFILLLKKRVYILKKIDYLRLKLLQTTRKTIILKYYLNIIVVNI